jgi:hypothetical protein
MSCNYKKEFLKTFSSGLFWGAVALKCIQYKFGIL